MNKTHLRRWLALAILYGSTAFSLGAQEPSAIRKIGLPTLDSQVRARLIALDHKLDLVHSPTLATSIVAQLTLPASPLFAFTPVLSDPINLETWEQLPELYRRLMQESGDALLAREEAPAGAGWSAGQTRRLCHQRLASLPTACLWSYRQGVDAEAKSLFDQGRRTLSAVPLRRLVDEMFCSSFGDQALDMLGDLAFERGEFEEARYWWDLLMPLVDAKAGSSENRLRFPDPQVDFVRVQAKQILAMIFQGHVEEARQENARFGKKYPRNKGALAGEDDYYHAILGRTLKAFSSGRIANNDQPWTTFGGDGVRNHPLTLGVNYHLWVDGPTWHVKLPSSPGSRAGDAVAWADRGSLNRRVSFHPVIINSQALVADQQSVVSYHLATGKELFRFDLKTAGLQEIVAGAENAGVPRFTLSADHERAYVRLGRMGLSAKKNAGKEDPSYLVCLDITRPEENKPRLLWHIRAATENKVPSYFEGSPLVRDGRVYIAVSKVVDRRTTTSIVCYDKTGKVRWSREVCDCPEFESHPDMIRYRQHLLSWAGGQVVYASNAGAIVAVDAWTGQPTWGVRYATRGPLLPDAEPSPRDLAPCIYSHGHVFAAPLDTDRLFCVNANTGGVEWELDRTEVVQLLGVSHGQVVMTTRTGIQAVDAATGLLEWSQPTEGRLPGLGRGMIAGNWLLWPTTDPLLPYRAVTLRSGQQQDERLESLLADPTLLSTMPVGNLAFGEGCLVVAGLDELVVFVPPQKLPKRPADFRPQVRIDGLYEKARQQTCAGSILQAAGTYLELLDATRTDAQSAVWQALIEGRLLLLAAEEAEAGDRKTQATTFTDARMPERVRTFARHKPAKKTPLQEAKKTNVLREKSADTVLPSLPLVRSWVEQDGRVWPIHNGEAGDDFFFCTQGGQVSCRGIDDGKLRWRDRLGFAPDWFGRWRDLIVIAGADAAQARLIKDGSLVWTFSAPSRVLSIGTVKQGTPRLLDGPKGFVYVDRWDDTLLLLDDCRSFYRLQIDSGEPVWRFALPDDRLRPLDAGAYRPQVARVGQDILAQNISGQPELLSPSRKPLGSASRYWVQKPVVADDSVIFAGEGGRIHAYDLGGPHALRWTYQARWPTSLTGALCPLFGNKFVLLALVPRNDGGEWTCIDVRKGLPLWTRRASAQQSEPDIGSVCLGDTAYYYIQAGRLHARSLSDGSVLWELSLPARASRWRMSYNKAFLAVSPAEALQDADFFVGYIDPWEGQWIQRLNFPNARGRGDLMMSANTTVVSVQGNVYGFRSLDRK